MIHTFEVVDILDNQLFTVSIIADDRKTAFRMLQDILFDNNPTHTLKYK